MLPVTPITTSPYTHNRAAGPSPNSVLLVLRIDLFEALIAIKNQAHAGCKAAPSVQCKGYDLVAVAQRKGDASTCHPATIAALRAGLIRESGRVQCLSAVINEAYGPFHYLPPLAPPAHGNDALKTSSVEAIKLLQLGAHWRKNYEVGSEQAQPAQIVQRVAKVIADAKVEASQATQVMSLARMSTMSIVSQLAEVALASNGGPEALAMLSEPDRALAGLLPSGGMDDGVLRALRPVAMLATR